MEDKENLVFFDSVEAEENFLKGKTSTPSSARRLSAASRATSFKNRNLIPPLHSPSDRRVSLPRASKTTPVSNMPAEKKKPTRQGESAEEPTPSEKFIAEQLAALTAMIGGVKEDISRAESRTGDRIDSKVDDLALKLGARMSKAETDLARITSEVATTRAELQSLRDSTKEQEKALPSLAESLVKARIAPDQRSVRRPRPLPETQASQPLVPTAVSSRSLNEERYWTARRTLRLWPVEGDSLEEAVISFHETKLKCPASRVSGEDFLAKRVYSSPDLAAQNQVVVTLSTVGLRDEVKSMAKNLSGQDRKTGVQLEAPDHLRGHYQAF